MKSTKKVFGHLKAFDNLRFDLMKRTTGNDTHVIVLEQPAEQ
jgi:hypothetical protein